MSRIGAALPLVLLLAAPAVAYAAAPQNIQQLATWFIHILNTATVALITVAIVIYFGGIATNMFDLSEGDREKMRAYFIWGILIIFVMVSIWGIIALLQNTLFQTASSSSTTFQTITN